MDQTGIAFLDIIFFAMVAGFLILRLRSVLGRRTGDDADNAERWRSQKPAAGTQRNGEPLPDNVARLPDRSVPAPEGPSAPGSVEAGVAAIRSVDGSFDAASFQQGARSAFEMIVSAFAQGDTTALRPLLADPVYDSFSAAVRERQAQKHTLSTTLIGIKSADLVEARLQGRDAFVTIKFVSEQVNVTRDESGSVVDGDPNKVETITDVWTFTRNTKARDPNWFLIQTDASH